jgi:Fic family protein
VDMGLERVQGRAGRYIRQPGGYASFIPAPLPPDPPLAFDLRLLALLSHADQALGRLDGVARMVPDADLFVGMYVRREAVLSSQIEGSQTTLEDLLAFELDAQGRERPRDVDEVVNYVRAMNHGLARLQSLPLSLRLIREVHLELLQGTRGGQRRPGEFRTIQNYIAAGRVPISRAIFVPPPVDAMLPALDDLERFLNDERPELPVLVQCGLAHAQFETIHPFLDGNGRVGRLLIALLLCQRGALQRPLLYLSYYLKLHRAEYYARLSAIRDAGDWEGWLRFFLRGVAETAEEATATAGAIADLRERHIRLVQERGLGANGLRLLDLLFRRPLVSVQLVREALGVAYGTANKLAEQLASLGLLDETTGARRNRRYRYTPYLALFREPGDPRAGPPEATNAPR